MGWMRVILIICVFWINGCSYSKQQAVKHQPITMRDVYNRSSDKVEEEVRSFIEERFREEKRFGYVQPYIPIVNQPVVRKVWVPDHKHQDNPDVMIAGHWVYLMIKPASWFIDEKTAEEHIPVIVPTTSLRK